MIKVVFQHLDTVNERDAEGRDNSDIYLFGRTLDGRSVGVLISSVRPHFCVKLPRETNVKAWFDEVKKEVAEYKASRSAIAAEKDPDKSSVVHVKHAKMNIPETFMQYEIIEGQDICDYNERECSQFLRITTQDKWVWKAARTVLSSKEQHEIIRLQIMQKNVDKEQPRRYTIPDKARYIDKGNTDTERYLVQTTCPRIYKTYTLYNDHVDFTLQHLIDLDIYSCSFIEAEGVAIPEKCTSCDVELQATSLKQVQQDGMAPWRILSYDIESVPHKIPGRDKYTFPSPWKDPVCTIGVVLQIGEELTQYVWILNGQEGSRNRAVVEKLDALTDPPDEYHPELTTVYDHDDELEMLESFIAFIIEKDVDFVEGHNINRFDNTYILNRYNMLRNGGRERPSSENTISPVMGRLLGVNSIINVSSFASKQKGAHDKYKLKLPGRVVLDSYDIMKDQHNEISYKLDHLAEKFLGTKKIDQDYSLIHPMFQHRKGRHDLAVYCVKDSWLVRRMMDKLCKLTVLLQMANVTGIAMKDVIERGQGIRTIALMLRYCRRRKPEYFIPRKIKEAKLVEEKTFDMKTQKMLVRQVKAEEESFEGAVVVEPTTGFYKDAVSCLDFASLYPSIMRAMNMSYETLVTDKQVKDIGWKERVHGEKLPGVRTIPDYEYMDKKLVVNINRKNPIFVTSEVRKGLLPEILESVLTERKKVKRMMKKLDPADIMYRVCDGRQLGLKVVANSIYGFTGSVNGFLPEKKIAASVTKYGRGMILRTKDKIENHPEWGDKYGCQCIYGGK